MPDVIVPVLGRAHLIATKVVLKVFSYQTIERLDERYHTKGFPLGTVFCDAHDLPYHDNDLTILGERRRDIRQALKRRRM